MNNPFEVSPFDEFIVANAATIRKEAPVEERDAITVMHNQAAQRITAATGQKVPRMAYLKPANREERLRLW